MAFQLVHGDCAGCGAFMSYNASHVPSLRDASGVRVAICRLCFDRWNQIHRIGQGLEPEPLHPEAYAPEEVP